MKAKIETAAERQWRRLDPEVRAAALAAGFDRAANFIHMTQQRGAPMSYGSGKPAEKS